jgi:DNA-directed RNA polymerase subunit H
MAKNFEVKKHILVPKHTKLNETEIKQVFEKNKITRDNLPCIIITDPAISELNAKEDDIIKITRKSPTAGTTLFYRRVING